MNRTLPTLLAAILTVSAAVADARDTRLKLPAAAGVAKAEALGKLPAGVKYYFGNSPHGTVLEALGEIRTNRKTNFLNKSDTEGCEWTFMSAIIALGERALQLGGNAVINIRSNYRNKEFKSDTEYECGAGALIGGVALIGDVAKL